MRQTAVVHDPSSAASRLAVDAHERAAIALQARHPDAARRQREAAVAARARLRQTRATAR